MLQRRTCGLIRSFAPDKFHWMHHTGSEVSSSPTLIEKPARVAAAGTKPKLIDEYIGRVNSDTQTLSITHMRSPLAGPEPGQTPEFDEYTGRAERHASRRIPGRALDVQTGQAVIAHKGEWVRYSTPAGSRKPNTSLSAARHLPSMPRTTDSTLDATHRGFHK